MLTYTSFPYTGGIDGRKTPASEALFLLDEHHRIIGVLRSELIRDLPPFRLGDRFFDLFPTTEAELSLLREMQNGGLGYSLLMRAGRRSVLMLYPLCQTSHVLIAAVPQRKIAVPLNSPAAYREQLEYICFSDAVIRRHRPENENEFNLLSTWCRLLHAPFFLSEEQQASFDAQSSALLSRAMYLAQLCQCELSCDFSDLAFSHIPNCSLTAFLGGLYPIMMLAGRLSVDQSVELRCEVHPLENGVLHAHFQIRDPGDPLPELAPLLEHAKLYGDLFEVASSPSDPTHLHIRYSFSTKEISVQGVKTPWAERESAASITIDKSAPEIPPPSDKPPVGITIAPPKHRRD